MSNLADRPAAFVARLEELVHRQDRGALAALRRGLGKPPGASAEAHRYVVPWLPGDTAGRRDEPYYLIAALFAAWYQGEARVVPAEGTLGRSFRALADYASAGSKSVERRFTALVASHRDDLPEHLRHAVSLFRAHGVPVNWAQLLRDIQWWDQIDRRVQRRWARDFWSTSEAVVEESHQPKSAASIDD